VPVPVVEPRKEERREGRGDGRTEGRNEGRGDGRGDGRRDGRRGDGRGDGRGKRRDGRRDNRQDDRAPRDGEPRRDRVAAAGESGEGAAPRSEGQRQGDPDANAAKAATSARAANRVNRARHASRARAASSRRAGAIGASVVSGVNAVIGPSVPPSAVNGRPSAVSALPIGAKPVTCRRAASRAKAASGTRRACAAKLRRARVPPARP
jgi:hypothetical protein